MPIIQELAEGKSGTAHDYFQNTGESQYLKIFIILNGRRYIPESI